MDVGGHFQEYEVHGVLTNGLLEALAYPGGHFASHAAGSQEVLLEATGHSWQCSLVVQINMLMMRDIIDPSFWTLTPYLSSLGRSD